MHSAETSLSVQNQRSTFNISGFKPFFGHPLFNWYLCDMFVFITQQGLFPTSGTDKIQGRPPEVESHLGHPKRWLNSCDLTSLTVQIVLDSDSCSVTYNMSSDSFQIVFLTQMQFQMTCRPPIPANSESNGEKQDPLLAWKNSGHGELRPNYMDLSFVLFVSESGNVERNLACHRYRYLCFRFTDNNEWKRTPP